ncbi:hypothetical protein EMN47_04305 [Prolixibacteraceae bacterium JC049]|nr:hypothetical protein [Prolixibacteraceae bacterium JC049]
MIKMRKPKNLIYCLLVCAIFITSCGPGSKDDPTPPKPQAPAATQKVNKFIHDIMSDAYLWSVHLPEVDYKYEFDSKKYFDKILYKPDDKWSFLTDDVVALDNSFKGTEKTFGYSLAFGTFSNTGNMFAIVRYVYPNTPAAEAGMKRGDLIVQLNGADITKNNYRDLLFKESIDVTMGELTDSGISTGGTKQLTAKELTLDPVLIKKVIEHGGQKIGYLFYAQYIANFNNSIDAALSEFKAQNVDNVILDLRYNPGGGVNAASHLCSSLAPTNVVNNTSQLITFQWNDKYQNYWKSEGRKDQLEVNFDNSVPVKMNLDKLFVLTGKGSASASELTITGLKPYMNITTVGDTTHGKYTASITFRAKDVYKDQADYVESFKNWALQPIVLRYANSQGETDFKKGFAPNHYVKDELLPAVALGEKNEPLLKEALERLTGTVVIAMKKASIQYPAYTIFDSGFSKFDKNKEVLHLGTFKK